MTDEHVIVQHSGYGYKENPQFKQGLETRRVTSNMDRQRILAEGGIIFPSYGEAEDFTMQAMHPPGHTDLVPAARGTFSDQTIDGLRIYIPVRQVLG